MRARQSIVRCLTRHTIIGRAGTFSRERGRHAAALLSSPRHAYGREDSAAYFSARTFRAPGTMFDDAGSEAICAA